MDRTQAERIADRYFDDYMIDHRMFTDGDERWLAIHNIGWSSTDYVTTTLWLTLGKVQVEWFENDSRFSMEWYRLRDWEQMQNPIERFL